MNGVSRRTLTALLLCGLAARAEPAEIRVVEQYGIAFLPLMVMRDRSLVEAHAQRIGASVRVSWTRLGAVNAINDALLAGQVDFAAGGIPSLVMLWSKTRGAVRAVGALGDMPNDLVVRRPEIHSVRDFGPQDKIAVTAVKISNQAIALEMAAAKEFGEASFDKLDPLTVGMAHPDATIALLSGSTALTAHFSSPPFMERELRNPGLHAILSTYDVLGGPATLNAVWTRTQFQERNPRAQQAFVEALEESIELINRDKPAAAGIYKRLAHAPESTAEIEAILNDPRMRFTTTPHGVLRTATFMHRTGRIKERPASWKDLFFENVQGRDGS
jgi:NitT/TauT family transport system substrate-binding protein